MHDVVIVGAGPAGITLALELAGAGLDVALLESGGEEFDPETQALNDGRVTGHEVLDLMAGRLRLLGGTTNHWGGHCLPMDAIDFRRRPLSGLSGWPFDRDALLPHYERAHDWLQLGRFDYGRDIGAGLDDGDFLLPQEPRILSAPVRMAHGPLRMGERYGPALRDSPRIDLQMWSNAVGLTLQGDDRITGVQVAGLDGTRREVPGRAVVLACGAVENARILMLANARHGRRFGDAGGMLGRAYMDHPSAGAGFLHFATPVTDRAYWRRGLRADDGTPLRYVWRLAEDVLQDEGLVNAHFYLIPLSDDADARRQAARAGRADGALRGIAKWALGRPDQGFVLSDAYCEVITNADSLAAHTWTQTVRGARTERALLRFESAQLPDRTNRVTLSDDRDALGQPLPVLHWAPGATERDSMLASAVMIGRLCGEHGLGRFELETHFDEPFWGTYTAWHQTGTTRMAENPLDGVVDADARVHGTRNLFMAGGSVMPTVGRANPTLTLVALAVRLADHLQAEGVER